MKWVFGEKHKHEKESCTSTKEKHRNTSSSKNEVAINKGVVSRFVSVLLAVLLVITMVPAFAFAEGSQEQASPENQENLLENTGDTPAAEEAQNNSEQPAEQGSAAENTNESALINGVAVASTEEELNALAGETGSLTISSMMERGSQSQLFEYSLSLTSGGQALTDYTGITIKVGENAVADFDGSSFMLSHNQSAVITGIPIGSSYTVVQSVNSDYTATPTNDSGTISDDSAVNVSFSNACDAPGIISATIEADNGTIDLGGNQDLAQMSYQDISVHSSQVYNLRIELAGLDPDKTNTFTVACPRGMEFQYTTMSTFLNQAGAQFRASIDEDPSKTFFTPGTLLDSYSKIHGTFTFTLKPKEEAVTVYMPVRFNNQFETDTITNALRVTLSDGSVPALVETLETVKRQIDPGLRFNTHPHTGTYTLFTDGDEQTLPDLCRQVLTVGSGYASGLYITEGVFVVKVSDQAASDAGKPARAKLINTSSSSEWNMSFDSATDEYTFTYTPAAGYIFSGSLTIPYSIEYPETVTPAWNETDFIDVTVTSDSKYTFLQFAEGDPDASNIGSTISSDTAVKYLTTPVVHTSRYQEPKEKVFVNYENISTFIDKYQDTPARSFTFGADIDNAANPNDASSVNDEVGVLGFFTLGNAGTEDSAPKTVEMSFSSSNYGVMALDVPFPAKTTLKEVYVKTTENNSWTKTTVNSTADEYGRAYLSYLDLNISSRDVFITGIKYDIGVIEAGKLYTQEASPGTKFFGKWLAENSYADTATASIMVYDTVAAGQTPAVSTGAGIVSTKQIDTNATGYPETVSRHVTAGETLSFSIPISAISSTPRYNATTEHPIFYIRQEIVDENGVPLPIDKDSIVLSNGGRLAGEIDSSKLIISNWIATEGNKKVAIYKIDTSALPGSQVCLMRMYVDSTGKLTPLGLTLDYQIKTTALTPTQTKLSREMVFIRDKDALGFTPSANGRRVSATSDPLIYESLRNGETWSTGVITARAYSSDTYSVKGVQSIHVDTQIKRGTSSEQGVWAEYSGTPLPIIAGNASDAGVSLKVLIENNAGSKVTATDVYLPVPKVGQTGWGSMMTGNAGFSLDLLNSVGVRVSNLYNADDPNPEALVGSYTIKFGSVSPTDNGQTLRSYTWLEASQVSDWSAINCVQIIANNIADGAVLEVSLGAQTSDSSLIKENLSNVWQPLFRRDLSNSSGDVFANWELGSSFGVQSTLSAVKGLLFEDVNRDGLYNTGDTVLDGTGWTLSVYQTSNTTNALETIALDSTGIYAIYGLTTDPDNYVLKVSNPSNTTYMFTTTATRAADNATGIDFGPWGANTFVSTNNTQTEASATITAQLTTTGTSPKDIANNATFNIGLAQKTSLTWQSSDVSRGTVAGDSSTGKKTLTGFSTDQLPADAAPAVSAAAGYTFAGWYRAAVGATAPAWNASPTFADPVSNSSFGAGDGTYGFAALDYYAVFSANTNTGYKVEHYLVDAAGVATLDDTETLTGTTEALVEATPKTSYTNYVYVPNYSANNGADKEVKTGKIVGDGSLVLKLYYKTDINYTISYEGNGGTGQVASQQVKYSQQYKVASGGFSRPGYVLRGWNTQPDGRGISFSAGGTYTYNVLTNTTLYAMWDPSAATRYTVEHYLVNYNNQARLDYAEQRTGVTNNTASASQRYYAGYSLNLSYPGTMQSGKIAADGSTVLRLFYQVNVFTVTFVDWDGTVFSSQTVPYGGSALAPVNPIRLGHTFTSWDRAYTNITSNTVVTAQYTPLTYTIVFEDHDGTVLQTTKVNYGESVTPPTIKEHDGFTFERWNKESSAWTKVIADATITAVCNDETTTPVPYTATDEPEPSTPSTPAEQIAQAAEEQGIPVIGIPLAAPDSFSAWALLNLILAVIGVLYALIMLVTFLRRRRTYNKRIEAAEDKARERQRALLAGENLEKEEEEDLKKQKGITGIIIMSLAALVGVIVFILTEDISLPMVWADKWTIVNIILLVAAILSGIVALLRTKKEVIEEPENRNEIEEKSPAVHLPKKA